MEHTHIMKIIESTSKKITLCESAIQLDEEEKKSADELMERKRKRQEEEAEAEYQRQLAEDDAKDQEQQQHLEQEGQAMAAAVLHSPNEPAKAKAVAKLVDHFHGR